MSTWIVLLRGINVGGHNRLPMKSLVETLVSHNCTNIRTYIQSGNVVLDASDRNAGKLAQRVRKAIADEHAIDVPVVALAATSLRAAARANPFLDVQDPKQVHLFFLSEKRAAGYTQRLDALRNRSEAWVLSGQVLYLHLPEGMARSRLATGAERALGVEATARNWRTVSKLIEML